MPLPFAAFETTVNAGTLALFGNARAQLLAGGEPFTVVFEDPFADALGIDGALPAATCESAAVAGAGQGDLIRIDRAACPGQAPATDAPVFAIRSTQPTEGLVRLVLEVAL